MYYFSDLENSILKSIYDHRPYSLREVCDVYYRCKSFDKTIEVLDAALELGISPSMQMENLGIPSIKYD